MASTRCPVCGSQYNRSSTRCALDGSALEALPDPLVGQRLGGRYRVGATLGAGAMAVVYEGVDERSGDVVALKVPDAEVLSDRALRQRFVREARLGLSLRHAHLAATLDADVDGDRCFLALERLYGETLATRLSRGALSVGDALALGRQLADALAALHASGVVHRDLKPSNVFLCDAAVLHAKVLDLGVARVLDEAALTRAGASLGTARTMSPEQVRGDAATAASDLYALGVVLFEALTGAPLFRGNDLAVRRAHLAAEPPRLAALRDDIPEGLDALVTALLAKSPAARPDSAEHVRARLDALADDPAGATEMLRGARLRALAPSPLPRVEGAALTDARRACDTFTTHWQQVAPVLDELAALAALDDAMRTLRAALATTRTEARRAVEWELALRDEEHRALVTSLAQRGVTRALVEAHVEHARQNADALATALARVGRALR